MTADVPEGLEAIRAAAAPLTDRFMAADRRLYLVGGVVRDRLLGRLREENDLDATTDARPDEIKQLIADIADAVWNQGERFGTIGCRVDGRIYEITTHRAEAYDADSRKPVVTFGDRIEDDLARRDFTVNAMAIDLATGAVIDPHGGRDDLAAGVLRTPLDPAIAFSEDPLRMLRAARFLAGYGLDPEPSVRSAVETMGDRLSIVSIERVRDELQKLLLLPEPEAGLRFLAETALLGVALPALTDLDGEDAARRGRQLATVAADPGARWATLLVDHDATPAMLGALRFSGALSSDVIWFTRAATQLRSHGLDTTAPAIRRAAAATPTNRHLGELLDWFEAIEPARAADVAVARSRLAELAAAEPDLADPTPLLTGQEVCALLGIEPGREVGVALGWLRDLRLDEGPIPAEDAARRLADWWPTRTA